MPTVDEAFRAQPREHFLPAGQRARAHLDAPLLIGHGQTNSQPSTVAQMLRLLEVPEGARVLDVGSGSGWTTALLAHLVGPSGSVLGVELEPELAEWGRSNVAASDQPWARVELADPEVLGRPDAGPYDRILVSAEAAELPEQLVDQLARGGRMVAPVAGGLCIVDLTGSGRKVSRIEGYRFVPLR